MATMPHELMSTPVALNDDLDAEIDHDELAHGGLWAHLELQLEEALDDARENAQALIEATCNLRGRFEERLGSHFRHALKGDVETARYYRSQLQDLVQHEGDVAYLEELDERVRREQGIMLVLPCVEHEVVPTDIPWEG